MTGTTVSQTDYNWRLDAPCGDGSLHPDTFFDMAEEDEGVERMVKATCAACPVREMCLEAAMSQGEEFGIFGGMTPQERDDYRPMWKRMKKITDGGAKAVRAKHGVLRHDPGVERKYEKRTAKARIALEQLQQANDVYRKDEYIQVLDMIISNQATNMTLLAERLGKSRAWFEGMFRNVCKQFGSAA